MYLKAEINSTQRINRYISIRKLVSQYLQWCEHIAIATTQEISELPELAEA